MRTTFIITALIAAVTFASPLQGRDAIIGGELELPTPPALTGWGSHLIQDWLSKVGLRRSGNPSLDNPEASVSVSVTVVFTTEVVTATATMPATTVPATSAPATTTTTTTMTTTTASAPASTSTADSATASSSSWDFVLDDAWEGDEPANMTYAKPVLDAHNIHRANHSIVNLKWNTTMEQTAKEISETCYYGHSRAAGDGNYGQNIGAGFTDANVPAMVGDSMYNDEIELYPGPYGQEPDMTNFESWGHYSQIVWKDTTDVGCWTTDCSSVGLQNVAADVSPKFTVCNYYPVGNVIGEFGAKVPSPGDLPMVLIPTVD